MKQQEAMKNLIIRMATLNMKTINFQEIIDNEGKHPHFIRNPKTVEQTDGIFRYDRSPCGIHSDAAVEPVRQGRRNPTAKKHYFRWNPEFDASSLGPSNQEIHKAEYFIYTLIKTYVSVSSP